MSFSSRFSKDARGHKIRLEDIDSQETKGRTSQCAKSLPMSSDVQNLEKCPDNYNQENRLNCHLTNLDTGKDMVFCQFTSFQSSPVNSQIDKFYKKYGRNWRELYIGSLI